MSKFIEASHERQRLFIHNLANKLNVLIGNCDLLAEKIPDGSPFRRQIMTIQSAAHAMAAEMDNFRSSQREHLENSKKDIA